MPIVHAAKTDHPVRQGLWGIMEVFIDTHLICTLTGLVLIVTGPDHLLEGAHDGGGIYPGPASPR